MGFPKPRKVTPKILRASSIDPKGPKAISYLCALAFASLSVHTISVKFQLSPRVPNVRTQIVGVQGC